MDLEVARSTDAYVEDFIIRQQEEGREVVQFQEGPTKTRSGGITILRRTTLQTMYSTNGGKTDQVHLFKLWLSKRPDGMKDNGPLCLSVSIVFNQMISGTPKLEWAKIPFATS